jgi:hypothetical protein
MFRKLLIAVFVIALAGAAYAQVPQGPNDNFNDDPWSGGNPTQEETQEGFLPGYDYHMEGVYDSGSGMDTVWEGHEWGSGYAEPPATQEPIEIGANMCTMGIAVFSDFGIQVDLDNRFYEINLGAVHDQNGWETTIAFGGHVATNQTINLGLRAPDGGELQFPDDEYNPKVTEIRAYKDGARVGTWQPDEGQVTEALFSHSNCHAEFTYEIDVHVPTHVNDGMTHLPFYFCPESGT